MAPKTCYARSDNTVFTVLTETPCSNDSSGFQHCCVAGDECLPNGFCHFTHSYNESISVTGFYLGGCTNPDFAGAACPQHCNEYDTEDVVYSSDEETWACCYGSGKLDCNVPSNETFYAPAPSILLASAAASSSTTSSAVSSTATGNTSTKTSSADSSIPTSSNHVHPSSASGSNINTTTVILATVIPVVILILALSFGFWWWIRKKLNQTNNDGSTRGFSEIDQPTWDYKTGSHAEFPTDRNGGIEMSTERNGAEVGGVPVGELSGDMMKRPEISRFPSELDTNRF